jgi:EAL domain-containing protein (putative c-di-GMP-specific phosphodiesterase class I)
MGLLSPGEFIHLAEDTGTIEPITEWVLCQACAQNKAWQDSGYPRMDVAVNVSQRVLQQGNLVTAVQTALSKTELPPQYLTLEVTETAILKNPEHAVQVLKEIEEIGVRICIDDFGAGYSSFGNLKHLPISAIKIDPSFVKNVASKKEDMSIVAAILAMAHAMALRVTAEGVETLEQLDLLRSMGCDEVQGYFIGRPVSSEDLAHLLREGKSPLANWASVAA